MCDICLYFDISNLPFRKFYKKSGVQTSESGVPRHQGIQFKGPLKALTHHCNMALRGLS